jgi:hypothetical protein
MTNSQPHSGPSQKQLDYHRDLVGRTGAAFTSPQTRSQASRQIKAMLAMPRDSHADRRRDGMALRADLDLLGGDGARVRDDELAGYGSNARWR